MPPGGTSHGNRGRPAGANTFSVYPYATRLRAASGGCHFSAGAHAGAIVELRHLRYFVAVTEAGTFVKAARALNVAQPALSRQIQDLERQLGVTLLERHPHGVRLTRVGRTFLTDARRMLSTATRAATRVRAAAGIRSETLRVGYGELLAHWRSLVDTFYQVRMAHPAMKIQAAQMPGPAIRAALREDAIDVGIVAIAKWPRGLDGTQLIDGTQTGALLPGGHPVARSDRVRAADLETLTWLHLPPEATLGCFEHVLSVLRARGCRSRHRALRAGSYGGLPQIAACDGWALSDERLASVITTGTKAIVYRPFSQGPIKLWIAALWKRDRRTDILRDFLDVAKQVCHRPDEDGGGMRV